MNRFNIFYNVHKALRSMLFETAALLQQTDFSDSEEAQLAIAQVDEVLRVFDKHAETEDHFILKAIQRFDNSITGNFSEDHLKDFALTTRMRGLFTAHAHAVNTDDQLSVGASINRAFVEFLLFNLNHMAKEEQLLNPSLWLHYSDDQLKMISRQIQAQVPVDISDIVMKWMIRSFSNSEIINWLKDAELNGPDSLLCKLISLVESELSASRKERILDSMTEGSLMTDC